MKKIILSLLLVLILFPISSSFSQGIDKPPTLGLVITSTDPYHFKDEQGYTIILGEVENTKNFVATGVTIQAFFYDDFSKQPIESTLGGTVLDVIPPFGKSPFILKSETPNSAITNISVNLSGFFTAAPKEIALDIETKISEIGDRIKISGNISNNGALNSSETIIHVFFYDIFNPPRILGFSLIQIGEIESGASINFEFDEKFDHRYATYKIFAESTDYHASVSSVEINPEAFTKIIAIEDISMNDSDGNKLTGASQGTTINIESNVSIQYSSGQDTFEQPFVYYAQVKQSEEGFVEFIGKFEGTFQSTGTQSPLVEWTPQNKGLYFIETFVWDPNAVPLASKGPIMLVLVT